MSDGFSLGSISTSAPTFNIVSSSPSTTIQGTTSLGNLALGGQTTTPSVINGLKLSSPTAGGSTVGIAETFDYSKYTSPEFNASTSGASISKSVINGITSALPAGFKQDVQMLSDLRLGSVLRNHGILNGNQASILNGLVDFIRKDTSTSSQRPNFSVDYKKYFIPIIIQTEFNLNKSSNTPFYVVFDSTPESISFNKTASWNTLPIYGRPEPIQIFNTSSAVSFSLTGNFFSFSLDQHQAKLDLSNRLFALTTPSKFHIMPSPVTVKIGEWKTLRCIITDVKIDYKGPWWIPTDSTPDIAMSKGTALSSHSPYLYDATFSFVVVSELNTVQYAEDIIANGWNGGKQGLSSQTGFKQDKLSVNVLARASNSAKPIQLSDSSIAMSNTTFSVAPNSFNVNSQGKNYDYLRSLGLPTSPSGSTSGDAAMAQITSGLRGEITSIINNRFGSKISKILGK